MSQVITDVRPSWAVPGGRVTVSGRLLPRRADGPPHVLVGGLDAQVVAASRERVRIVVPAGAPGGTTTVRFDELPGETAFIEVAKTVVTGIHQVDNPLFDGTGSLLVTESGTRGNRMPVPLHRVAPDGSRTPLAVEVGNPTSLALGPDGLVYVSNRFDGNVYRLVADDQVELFAGDLGVATGLAFDEAGTLYIGDRSGSIFRIGPERRAEVFATLPASIAAFHLAFGPSGDLFVTAPTLASHDAVYRISPDRLIDTVCDRFGRPQGLAFDSNGVLYVADALAGSAGLYRLELTQERPQPELLVAAPALVGVAFDPAGGLVLASNDAVWRLDVPLKPLRRAARRPDAA